MNLWWSLCASVMLLLGGLPGCSSLPPQQHSVPNTLAPADGASALSGTATTLQEEGEAADFQRALSLMRAQRYAEAAVLWESIVASSPQSVLALLNLGITYSRLGKLEQAQRSFRQVLQQDAGNAIAYNELGIVERKAGRFLQAEDAYRRALQWHPEYALAHLNLGMLCDLYLQKADCAMRHYQAYRRLAGGEDPPVDRWIEDLIRRYPDRQWRPTGE